MNILCISGSPRKDSNTDYLLKSILNETGGSIIKLADHVIEPCNSCWACRKSGVCVLQDDMEEIIIPRIMKADVVVLGSPVYFNNVSAQMKAFIDRTWSIRGKLRNKIGASVVVGRKYGSEGAIMAINAFFLKHEMLVANRGICGIAFKSGDIEGDAEAQEATVTLADRLLELGTLRDNAGMMTRSD
jgi:multimeric flavodoxin WrbA